MNKVRSFARSICSVKSHMGDVRVYCRWAQISRSCPPVQALGDRPTRARGEIDGRGTTGGMEAHISANWLSGKRLFTRRRDEMWD